MLIINHRVNTLEELKATPKEFGVEVDVRALEEKLILNHDPHKGGDSLEEYLKTYNNSFIVFDIKEAGIEDEVISLAEKYNIKDYFLLGVEFPYIYHATRKDHFRKIAIRYSESEPIEMAFAQVDVNQHPLVDWIWVDTNTQLPLDKEIHDRFKQAGFKLCLVCPERWGRPQDIKKYIAYMNLQGIRIDAVMTSLNHAQKWKELK
jgi:hypothetical protein